MVQIVEPLLGTRAEVSVVATAGVDDRSIEDDVLAEVARLEAILTAFDDGSDLSVFRRTGQAASPELREVLDLADEWALQTAGAFNPRIEQLTTLWSEAERDGIAPSADSIAEAVRSLESSSAFSSVPSTVFSEPFSTTDLQALAKGWVAERALTSILEALDRSGSGGTVDAWLSLGGDIVHRGSASLTVGIENPARPYDNVAPLAAVEIANESLATSGGARRFWTIDGVRHSKVLDPRTGSPVDHIASATVIAPSGVAADVLATVATILEPAETLELVDRCGADCLLVERNGGITKSTNRFVLV